MRQQTCFQISLSPGLAAASRLYARKKEETYAEIDQQLLLLMYIHGGKKKKMTRREYLVRCVARSSPRLFLSGICFEWSLSAVRTCASRWLRRDACPVFSESITIYAGAAALHAVLFLAPVLYSCFVYTYDCARIPNV